MIIELSRKQIKRLYDEYIICDDEKIVSATMDDETKEVTIEIVNTKNGDETTYKPTPLDDEPERYAYIMEGKEYDNRT